MKRTELKRRTPLTRKTPMPRGSAQLKRTAIKKRNPERARAERLRCYGPPERNAFVRELRCFGCHSVAGSEPAHLVTDGMSRKADADKILPLCFWCHKEQHRVGNAEFAAARGLTVDDLFNACAETERLWQLYAHS